MKLPKDTSKVPYYIWYNNGLYTDWLLIPDVLETLATYGNNPRLWNSHLSHRRVNVQKTDGKNNLLSAMKYQSHAYKKDE